MTGPPRDAAGVLTLTMTYFAQALHQWMLAHRQKVPDGSGTAKALDYSLKRWAALTRYLDDGAVPYLKDVLTRLPTQRNNAIDELLPHNWKPAIPDKL